MPSVLSIIEAICPGLYTDTNRDTFITLSYTETSESFFGTVYNKAVALRASHDWVLAQRTTGDSGSISSKKEGDLSINYSTVDSSDDPLLLTSYGQQLRGLIKSRAGAVSVAGIDDIGRFYQ